MSIQTRDLDALKAAYGAWHDSKGKSADTWLALMADDVDFRSLANGGNRMPWTKHRNSREGVRDYLVGLTTDFIMEHYTVDRYVCEGDTIVAIASTAWRSAKTGKKFETPKVDVWRFKDGKIVYYFEYYDTATVAAAATP